MPNKISITIGGRCQAASITFGVNVCICYMYDIIYDFFYDRWKGFYYVRARRRRRVGRYTEFTAVFMLSCRDHNNIVVFTVHIALRTKYNRQ